MPGRFDGSVAYRHKDARYFTYTCCSNWYLFTRSSTLWNRINETVVVSEKRKSSYRGDQVSGPAREGRQLWHVIIIFFSFLRGFKRSAWRSETCIYKYIIFIPVFIMYWKCFIKDISHENKAHFFSISYSHFSHNSSKEIKRKRLVLWNE